jgi:glycosyltransferase involved in cell wall biosynthesis
MVVAAVVAARNEEGRIGPAVRALRDVVGDGEVLVVADGCSDRTAQEALAAGARVLCSERAAGKGGAVEAGLRRCRSDAEIVLLVDGDVGETAAEVARLLEEVASGRADLAIGRLPAPGGGGFGVVKRFAAGCIRRIGRVSVDEPLSGQRAIRRSVLDACRPLAPGFGLETAMTIDAARLGARIVEVPVEMRHRPTGRSLAGFLHRGGQGLDILLAVIPRAFGLR